MEKILIVNKSSQDTRVLELEKIYSNMGMKIYDFCDEIPNSNAVVFLEPRCSPREECLKNLPMGCAVFGYIPKDAISFAKVLKQRRAEYFCLSDDVKFVKENNRLTAVAMRDILLARHGNAKK